MKDNLKTENFVIKRYFIITLLLIIYFFVYLQKGISFAGQLSDKLLFWFWIIQTIRITKKLYHRKIVKWNVRIIGILLILSLLPAAVPFKALIEFTFTTQHERKVEEYRLREFEGGFFETRWKVLVVKNLGVFEIEVDDDMDFGELSERHQRLSIVDDIHIIRDNNFVTIEFIIDGLSYRRFITSRYSFFH